MAVNHVCSAPDEGTTGKSRDLDFAMASATATAADIVASLWLHCCTVSNELKVGCMHAIFRFFMLNCPFSLTRLIILLFFDVARYQSINQNVFFKQ